MAWALIDSTSGRDSDRPSLNTVSADLIVAMWSGGTPAFGGLTDSASNTWTPLTSTLNINTSVNGQLGYVVNPNTSATHTFDIVQNFEALAVMAFSGAFTSGNPFDQQAGSMFTAGTSKQVDAVTPTEGGELIIVGWGINDVTPSGLGINQSFSLPEIYYGSPAAYYGVAMGYLVSGSTADPTFSWTGSAAGVVRAATFKSADGGGAPSILTKASYHLKRMKD